MSIRRLLQIEWMKVKNYRTFWILLVISIVSIPAFNYSLYSFMNNSFPKIKGKSVLGSPFALPDVWQTVAWNSTLLFLFPAILIITLVTNEFVYKTHRQNVIDGLSRQQFITVKLVEVLLMSALNTLIVILTALGFGLIGNKLPDGMSIWHECRFIGFYFVQMLSYSLIAFLLAMLIKRAGLALGIFLIYMVVENIIVGISRNIYHIGWGDYLPEEVTDRLIPQPYLKIIVKPEDTAKWESQIPVYLTVAAIYIIIYAVITANRFRRSDL